MTEPVVPSPKATLASGLRSAPHLHDAARADQHWQDLCAAHGSPIFAEPQVTNLLRGIFSASPFVSELILRDPVRLVRMLDADPDAYLAALHTQLHRAPGGAGTLGDTMRALRIFKGDIALLTALADLGGVWPVMTVTRVLSEAADAAVQAAVRHLFAAATARGDWVPPDPEAPEQGSGYVVIAMGKHGAFELNYSSDIDLIVFYDPERSRLRDGLELAPFMVRLTRDLVRILQERTSDGYVFRTDLRLRPDAGATAIAMSTNAAMHYYESFGQNWERAALIKARAIAGDLDAGLRLLGDLAPFIWRKNRLCGDR
jgi:[glutamine synthetase] adenylyltransferase / [glutamine synthetase]-adenylyl-L-tyrosine phosphorylase